MYSQYVGAVLRKALDRMQGVAELLLLLVALATPAIVTFAGMPMPAQDNIFAYLGVALVVLVVLRIFFVAPYQLWREQVGEIGTLKLELSEPERAEIAHMASIRAGKRLELAAVLRELHWLSFTLVEGDNRAAFNEVYGRALALMGQAGVPEGFTATFGRFTNSCIALNRSRKRSDTKGGVDSMAIMEDLTAFLHGRMTAEQLALKLAERPNEPELPLGIPAADTPEAVQPAPHNPETGAA